MDNLTTCNVVSICGQSHKILFIYMTLESFCALQLRLKAPQFQLAVSGTGKRTPHIGQPFLKHHLNNRCEDLAG